MDLKGRKTEVLIAATAIGTEAIAVAVGMTIGHTMPIVLAFSGAYLLVFAWIVGWS